MISFRYHLVSIVAVFLALGLGVLMGTTVLDQGIVSQLERQTGQLQEDLGEFRTQVDDLQAEIQRLDQFGVDIMPLLISGRLGGTEVVLVTHEDVDDSAVAEVVRALDLAGADITAALSVDSRVSSSDRSTREDLAEILGVAPSTPSAQAEQAALALARRLADGAGDSSDDLIGQLLSAGFVVSLPPAISVADLPRIGGGDQAVVVLAGGEGAPPLDLGSFMIPLVEELVNLDVPVAAVESATSRYRFVSLLRTDSAVAGSNDLVTVDDVGEPPGEVALVWGLDDLLDLGRGGHYGFKEGATSLVPAP
jgi:hypothetical protein